MRRRFALALLLGACTGSINAGIPQTDGGEFEEREAGASSGGDGSTAPRDGGAPNQPNDRDATMREDAAQPAPADSSVAMGTEAGRPAEDAARPQQDAAMAQPDAARDSAVQPSGDTVPVFVAVGYGRLRAISCDYGRSWKNEVIELRSSEENEFLTRGLAAGDGKFVAAVGGQNAQKLYLSENGVDWELVLPHQNGRNGYSDVTFGNMRFVAGGGHTSIVSTDGRTWGQEGTMGTGGILRNLVFGDYMGGRFVAVGDSERRMSSRDGMSWGAQVEGGGERLIGVAYGSGTFVAVNGTGKTYYSKDGGTTWQAGAVTGGSNVRGILHDRKQFIVTTSANTFTSNDGIAWASHAASGGPQHFDVSDDGQHYVGANYQTYYRSTDGLTWQAVVGNASLEITRLKFQRVKPSPVCPRSP